MRRTLSVLSLCLAFTLCGSAQTPAPASGADNVRPTVSMGMGDLGNKLYGRTPDAAKTRRYYIAAESQLWDYAPEGRDPVCGRPLPLPVVQQRAVGKVRYVEYTDDTFTVRAMQTPRLGILGPVLRGVVGETLAVTFLNRTTRPLSMHPHGVKYDKDSEGSYYEPAPGLGGAVGPGARFTYVWLLDEASGPRPGEPSSKAWLYHSHVNGDEESNLGLIGGIVVTDPKRARPDGTPNDVDREMMTLFMVFDESGLGEAEKEAAEHAPPPGSKAPAAKPWWQIQQTIEQGERAAINGYIFGNLPGLAMVEGERVRWYLLGLGGQKDFHTAHWHGARVLEEGRRRTDVVELMPASMKVADMTADNAGDWLFHCHVSEHMMEGMFARFTVHPKGTTDASAGIRGTLDNPFFGLRQARSSLQIKRAEVSPGANGKIAVSGAATVFQAFTVLNQPITLQLGGRTWTFTMGSDGVARSGNASFRVTNANSFGVIYGGVMAFELELSGDDWLRQLGRPGAAGAVDAPLVMEIGQARHAATARLKVLKN